MKKQFEICISNSSNIHVIIEGEQIPDIYKRVFSAQSPEELQRFIVGLLGRNTRVIPGYNKKDPGNFAFKRWFDMLYRISHFSLTAAAQLFNGDIERVIWVDRFGVDDIYDASIEIRGIDND